MEEDREGSTLTLVLRYLTARLDLLESQRRLEIEEEMQKQMEAELKRLLLMEEKQRHVLAARTHIEEDILQTRCLSSSGRSRRG